MMTLSQGRAVNQRCLSTLPGYSLHQAIWRKAEPGWQVCGIPDVLYNDNGTDFTSKHIEQVCADLKIRMVFSLPGKPRGRGRIERFFRTASSRGCRSPWNSSTCCCLPS